MSRHLALVAIATATVGCSLLTQLDELRSDASTPSNDASDANTVDVATDASTPITLVQKAQWSNQSPYTCTMPSAVGNGNTLIALAITSPPDALASISDTLGQTWKSTTFHGCTNENLGLRFFYVESSKPGADAVTMSLTPGNVDGIAVVEYAGVGPLEAEAGQCAGVVTNMTTPNVTTSGPGLLVAAFTTLNPTGNSLPGSGWTIRDNNGGYYTWEDQITVTGGSYAATASQATNSTWTSIIAAFKKR